MAANVPAPAAPGIRWHVAWWIVLAGLALFWGAAVVGAFRLLSAQRQDIQPFVLWIAGILIILILLALAGREINGRWVGVLIDSRNKLSLSRLQITLWTTLVLSAYLTVAIPRVVATVGPNATLSRDNALNITFPGQLVLAMGISAASFAGANVIKSSKKGKQFKFELKATPEAALDRRNKAKREFDDAENRLVTLAQGETNKQQAVEAAKAAAADAEQAATAAKTAAAQPGATPAVVEAAAAAVAAQAAAEKQLVKTQTLYAAALQEKEAATADREAKKYALQVAEEDLTAINESQGLLHKNTDPAEARWADFVRGEEIGNYKLVEMSKVQMLFFTIVVIAAYAAAILSMLLDAQTLRTAATLNFPPFSMSLNELLGISHATYLSVKTVDHT